MKVLVLDSLFGALDIEAGAAAPLGGSVAAWSGDPAELATADIVAHVRTRVDAELIGALRSCRVIARFGTGLDTVDLAAAETAGIAVLGVRDYCSPELASHTLLLAFALLRGLRATTGQLDLGWDDVARLPIRRAEEAVVVGFGSVGRRVANALIALGYTVTVVTRHAAAEALTAGATVAPLDEALARRGARLSDVRAYRGDVRLDRRAPARGAAGWGHPHRHRAARAARRGRRRGRARRRRPGRPGPRRFAAADEPAAFFRGRPRVLITPHIGWYSERSSTELRRRTIAEALALARQLDNLEVSTP